MAFRHSEETKRKIGESLKGRVFSLETRKKISEAQKGVKKPNMIGNSFAKGSVAWNRGKNWSEEVRKKMSIARIGKAPWNKGKTHLAGENHWNWKGGVSNKRITNQRNDSVYQAWVKEIKKRDGKCRMENENCKGYLVVHHILGWAEYPAERYNVNNGITLCQGHHPMKRAEEKQLVPVFQKLVKNNY